MLVIVEDERSAKHLSGYQVKKDALGNPPGDYKMHHMIAPDAAFRAASGVT